MGARSARSTVDQRFANLPQRAWIGKLSGRAYFDPEIGWEPMRRETDEEYAERALEPTAPTDVDPA